MKRTKITLKRHKRIAKKLAKFYLYTMHLWTEVEDATGRKSRATKAVRELHRATDELRYAMDTECENLMTVDSWGIYIPASSAIARKC
jgi:hypothetical protein